MLVPFLKVTHSGGLLIKKRAVCTAVINAGSMLNRDPLKKVPLGTL